MEEGGGDDVRIKELNTWQKISVLSSIYLQLEGVNFRIFKLLLYDLAKLIVWNIQHEVSKGWVLENKKIDLV